MKPSSAGLPTSLRRPVLPSASVIKRHWAVVRTSFHSIAGLSTLSALSSSTELCICPDSPTASTLRTPAAAHAARTASTVACHQSAGSCSAQPGLETDTFEGRLPLAGDRTGLVHD